MKKYKFILILLLLFTFLILFNPKLAVEGAKNGLNLWFQSLLPTLLPFMILSGILIETKIFLPFCRWIHPVFEHLFHISAEGCIALFLGFFCGFPIGAHVTADLLNSRQISKSEAQYLLSICNNFSPVFLTGFVKTYATGIPVWNLLFVVYGAPILFALLTGKKKKVFRAACVEIPEKKNENNPSDSVFSISMADNAIMRSFSAITKLGGYLILFGIFAKMVTALKTVTILKAFLLTITEITTSIPYTAAMISSPALKEFILLSGLVFGGISGLAQTKSMVSDCALSIRVYAADKLKITGIALLLILSCMIIRNPAVLHLL